MRNRENTHYIYALLGRIVRQALATLALKTDPGFGPRTQLARADMVCAIDPASGDRRILHRMDLLLRSPRDRDRLNVLMISVGSGSERFAFIRARVTVVKGTCTNIAIDSDFEPDPSRN
jgi:hypothetical protein